VITFTGWEKRENLGRVYRGHDVFVTASTMETQGLVVLEAMASGLAVVGVNKFAVGDIVRSGKNGYLVRPGDYVGMAVKMVKILREVKLKADLGREARKTAEGHDIGETVKKIRNLYLVVMEKRRLANGGEVGAGFAEE
jgi:glycosyltransferase involved in cell wall biosynthesis